MSRYNQPRKCLNYSADPALKVFNVAAAMIGILEPQRKDWKLDVYPRIEKLACFLDPRATRPNANAAAKLQGIELTDHKLYDRWHKSTYGNGESNRILGYYAKYDEFRRLESSSSEPAPPSELVPELKSIESVPSPIVRKKRPIGVPRAAQIAGVSRHRIYKAVSNEELTDLTPGRKRIKIDQDQLLNWRNNIVD
jgi:hypothetical protein